MPTNRGEFMINRTGIEATEIFLSPVFIDESTTGIFKIMPNVPYKKKMLFAQKLDDIIREKKGCGFKPVGNLSIFERCVETVLCTANTEQCFDEFLDTVLMDQLNKGNNITDVADTVFGDIMVTRMQEAIARQIFKVAFFGSRADADPTNNFADGIWSVYIPDLVANNLIPRFDSTSGTALTAGQAIEILDALYEGAAEELRGLEAGQKHFLVAPKVFYAYRRDLRDGAANSCCFLERTEDGKERLFFEGIEVKKMERWESLAISTELDDKLGIGPITGDYNLVLYTAMDNLVLATDMMDAQSQIRVWHDELEELTYAKSTFKLGFNYLHPDLMAVAY